MKIAVIALLAFPAAGILSTTARSSWTRIDLENRMGDPPQIGLHSDAKENYAKRGGRDKPSLIIACTKSRPTLGLAAGVQIQPESRWGYGRRSIRIRLDDGKAERAIGSEISSGDGILLDDAKGWILKIAKARVAMIEITPFRSPPTAIPFTVEGLAAHAGTLEAYCGIKLPK